MARNNNKNGNSAVGKKDSLLNCLCDLFHNIASQKKKCGVLYPKKFITRLRKEYGAYCLEMITLQCIISDMKSALLSHFPFNFETLSDPKMQ